ncbi:MAG: PAS domain S-box protein, partial [Comamonas sp.]
MNSYLLRRIGQALLVLWAAFTTSFVLLQLMPGDAVLIKFLNPDLGLGPDQIAEIQAAYGTDQPAWRQYLHTLGQFLTGNFGYSLQAGVPVSEGLTTNLPPTLRLAALGLTVALLLALALALALGTAIAVFSVVVYRRMQDIGAQPLHITLLSGAVLGLATASLHYIAMDAIYLPVGPDPLGTVPLDGPWTLLTTTAAIGLLMGLLILIGHIALRWRQMLAQVQRSEARLQALVDTAVDGIVMIEGDGRIGAFNPAAERLLGWQAHEVIGRNVKTLMPAPHQQAHDGYLQHHLATGHTSIIGSGREVHALHKNGDLIEVRLAVGRATMADQPLFVGFLTDMRQRNAMEKSLRQSEEQLRTLISNIPGVTFRRTPLPSWQPLFLSTPVEALTGWPAEALMAQTQCMEQLLVQADIAALHRTVSEALESGVAYSQEYRLRHRDGSLRWVTESGRCVYDDQGQPRWIDGVLIDHTETKARNAEFEGT